MRKIKMTISLLKLGFRQIFRKKEKYTGDNFLKKALHNVPPKTYFKMAWEEATGWIKPFLFPYRYEKSGQCYLEENGIIHVPKYIWGAKKYIESKGYNPIGYSYEFFEHVWIFETSEEAQRAFEDCEQKGRLCAWWYGKEDLDKLKDTEIIHWF